MHSIKRSILQSARSLSSVPRSSPLVAPTRLPFRSPVYSLHTTRTLHQPTTTTSSAPLACPACHAAIPARPVSPVCPRCDSLVPPPPRTFADLSHFSLFSIDPPAYRVDLAQLKRRFLQLQQKVHPDRFGGTGDHEQWAKQWSGKVNQAWKVLSNDRERGEYLLSLHDVVIGESDPVTDPELLMSILETREQLEEAHTEQEVTAIRDTNAEATRAAVASLGAAFSTTPPDLEQARNLVIQLKYFDNVETVCREWSPGKRVEFQH
ncbi:hypothetical protein JCM10212_003043 [Sporobolomyces blumeae]